MASISGSGTEDKAASGKSGARSRAKTTSDEKAPTLRLKTNQLTKTPSTGELADMIATAAYFRAEQRGFAPGHELDDWLIAEQQMRARLSS